MTRSWWPIVPKSLRVAAAGRVVAGLILLLAAAVPASVLAVTGLNVEAQSAVLSRVDEAGTRTIVIVTTSGEADIPAAAVDRIGRLEGVAWVVGLGPVFDVRVRGGGGQPTPVRSYRGVRAPVDFGKAGQPGGAFVSTASVRRVGLGGAYSVLEPGSVQVVGWFRAAEPLSALESFILVPRLDDGDRLERVIVQVTDAGWVEPVAASLSSMLGAGASGSVTIQRSQALLDARVAVQGEVASRDREMVVALLVVAMTVACVVVFAGTIGSRRDFGRRRALGATRGQLTLLVMLQTWWPAALGAVAGTAIGFAYLGSKLAHLPAWQFPVSVGLLTTMALVGVSALPALVAASRDPLRVLRVP